MAGKAADFGKRTIEFTGGICPPGGIPVNRANLKRGLEEGFGEVEKMHMGNPLDQKNEPAWVRFLSEATALKVMEAIEKGDVKFNGVQLSARWRTGNWAAPTNWGGVATSRRDLDIDARDLLKEGRRGPGKSSRRDSRSRDRKHGRRESRSRDRKRDDSRDKKRSRSRDRRRKDSSSRGRKKSRKKSPSKSSSSEGKEDDKPHWSTRLAAKYFQQHSAPASAQGQRLPIADQTRSHVML